MPIAAFLFIKSRRNLIKLRFNVFLMKKEFEMNRLGRTNMMVSSIGFGGIVVMDAAPEAAALAVEEAIGNGINYFDVAPSYGDAEIKLGQALKPFRKDVYLACKTHLRDAAGARETFDQSLKNLKTDYFDVFQLHGLTDVEKDVKASFAKGGAMETILEAKRAGKIRNIGFSAHSPEAALTAMSEFDFDTILFPVNFNLHFEKAFELDVLKEARSRDMGILALKTLAKGKWPDDVRKKYTKCWYEPIDDPEIAELAINWTLSQGVSVAISPGHKELLELMVRVFDQPRMLNAVELNKLKTIAASSDPIF
jgi:aryl-alcohol dehydrogenase-like predicted oxidoreductase